jgi:hypothetical protein
MTVLKKSAKFIDIESYSRKTTAREKKVEEEKDLQ